MKLVNTERSGDVGQVKLLSLVLWGLILYLCLGGCASTVTGDKKFYKVGATEESFQQDLQACKYDIMLHEPQTKDLGDVFVNSIRFRDLMIECMKTKGYVWASPAQK